MKKRLIPTFLLLCVLAFAWIGPGAPAGDPAQEPEATPAVPAPDADEVDTDTPSTDANDSAAALETFVPSEKLPADSAISFPVDI